MTWNNPKVRIFDHFLNITGYIRTDILIKKRGEPKAKWVIIGQAIDRRGVVHTPRLPRIQE